ncbi:ribonuclease HI [Fluviicola sp.]|uniref:ribonuclease HI n=1 Tax=Fluviicola sp. TaxID=1917219 RepID=UPI00281E7C89|nr:ribonuclease HI [Fluviicola sp.]MDR0801354.1 ribonuclease HI [Fluviicola sp.]
MSDYINIYTDGSARGNPGPGGYGVILRYKQSVKEISQGYRLTTNNRMELLAVIVALENLKTSQIPVRIYSDSKYVIDAIQKRWVHGWLAKGFNKKKNKDLWMRYLAVAGSFKIELVWVKGHNGHPENERCDILAVEAALGGNLSVDQYFEEIQQYEN